MHLRISSVLLLGLKYHHMYLEPTFQLAHLEGKELQCAPVHGAYKLNAMEKSISLTKNPAPYFNNQISIRNPYLDGSRGTGLSSKCSYPLMGFLQI